MPADTTASGENAELSYEQARAELEEIVLRLEAGGVPLEESLALWERGEELARICQSRLDGARRRLERSAEPGQQAPPGEPGRSSAPGYHS